MFSSFFSSKKKVQTPQRPTPPPTVAKISIVDAPKPKIGLIDEEEVEYDGPSHLDLSNLRIKFVFLGSSAVGKTTIVERFSNDYGSNAITEQVRFRQDRLDITFRR